MSELLEWYIDATEAYDILTRNNKKTTKFYHNRRNKKRSDRIKAVKNIKNYSEAVTIVTKGKENTPWQKTAADILMLGAGATVGVLATMKSGNPATITAGSGKVSMAFYELGQAFYTWLD